MTIGTITRRAAGDGDDALLFEIFAAARAGDFAALPLDQTRKAGLMRMQFDARNAAYAAAAPDAADEIVLEDGEPVGRILLDVRDDEIRVVDIALLPRAQGRGIGMALLRQVLDSAGGKRVTLHVERTNPARRLYERLGFRPAADGEVYVLMEWRA